MPVAQMCIVCTDLLDGTASLFRSCSTRRAEVNLRTGHFHAGTDFIRVWMNCLCAAVNLFRGGQIEGLWLSLVFTNLSYTCNENARDTPQKVTQQIIEMYSPLFHTTNKPPLVLPPQWMSGGRSAAFLWEDCCSALRCNSRES